VSGDQIKKESNRRQKKAVGKHLSIPTGQESPKKSMGTALFYVVDG
jgi:hypothetical protein